VKFEELLGALLLIEPLGVKEGIKTAYGESDAVSADLVVLDGEQAGTEYPDTLIFPKVLQGQLKRDIGKKVLGRLAQGVAKPGQSAPWLLLEATAQDVELGQRYLASKATQVSAPAPAEPQAAPQWGQQAPPQQGAAVPF